MVRFGFRFVILAASVALLAGCNTPPASGDQAIPKTSEGKALGAGSPKSPSPTVGERTASGDDPVKAHAHYAEAVIRELNNEGEEALREYYGAALNDLGNEALVLEVSRRLLQARQPEKAAELLIEATRRPGASGTLYAQLGLAHSRSGSLDQAVNACRTAIRKDPRLLEGYRNLFVTWMQNRKPQEAFAVLEEAARVSRTGAEFLIGLGELYAGFSIQVPAQKDAARARGIAVLERADKTEPTDLGLRLRLADAFNLLDRDEEAARIYQDLLKRLPDSPAARESVRMKLTDLYRLNSDHKRAMEQLEETIRENPTDAQANYLLGGLAYDQKEYGRAIESFSRALLLAPGVEQVYYDLAGAQITDGKASDALSTLEKARQRFSRNFIMEYLTGMAFSSLKDYTNAVNHFNAAEVLGQATDPKRLTDTFYFQLGAACERKGDYAQSEKHFEKCLELSPNFAEAQNYLGYMWAERGEKLDRAHELIEKALQAEPKNAAYLDSMGWVLFKLNRPKEALEYILEAVRLSEEADATLYDHLGDIYAALSQQEKAVEAWRKSLGVENSEIVRKKLESSAAKTPAAK